MEIKLEDFTEGQVIRATLTLIASIYKEADYLVGTYQFKKEDIPKLVQLNRLLIEINHPE
jgi:hypothetical protein